MKSQIQCYFRSFSNYSSNELSNAIFRPKGSKPKGLQGQTYQVVYNMQ